MDDAQVSPGSDLGMSWVCPRSVLGPAWSGLEHPQVPHGSLLGRHGLLTAGSSGVDPDESRDDRMWVFLPGK